MTHPIAARTLEIATAQVNSPQMDGAQTVYETTAAFWETYVSRVHAAGFKITAHDVLQMLGVHAMSSTICAPDKLKAGNFVEQAACIAGAAQAASVEYPSVTKYPGASGQQANRQSEADIERELKKAVSGEKLEPVKTAMQS